MKIFTTIAIGLSLMSCNGTSSMHAQKGKTVQKVEYTEERRLNKNIDSKNILILNTTEQIIEFYQKLQNPGFTRQAPIPALEEKQSMLVIKPKLSGTNPYADLEIESLTQKGENLVVKYKEIENWEYTENKQSHPILILIIKNIPKSVILEKEK